MNIEPSGPFSSPSSEFALDIPRLARYIFGAFDEEVHRGFDLVIIMKKDVRENQTFLKDPFQKFSILPGVHSLTPAWPLNFTLIVGAHINLSVSSISHKIPRLYGHEAIDTGTASRSLATHHDYHDAWISNSAHLRLHASGTPHHRKPY
jgi:hypothetical protein